jgi:hypothetical protein
VDVPLQGHGIDVVKLTQQVCPCLIADIGGLQESPQGSEGRPVSLLDPAAGPDLLLQGHGGLEHIGTQGKEHLQLFQVLQLVLRIEPAVPDTPSDQGPVPVLHGAVVILVPGTGTGEPDACGVTVPPQFIIDELAPIVRVQDQDRERQVGEDMGEGSNNMDLCTVGHRDDLRPSGTAVRDREGVTMISCCLPSIMTDQVHLQDTGRRCREFPERGASGPDPGAVLPVWSRELLYPEEPVHGG